MKKKIKMINLPFVTGQKVFDDLTGKEATVIGVTFQNGRKYDKNITQMGCFGIWLNNDYVGRGRHPWEISELINEKT